MILDSGSRREFDTGAVRDIQDGKGRCDLLPSSVVFKITDRSEFLLISEYIKTKETVNLVSAIKVFCDKEYTDRYTAILEVSKHFEEGCKKYGDRNWEKGINIHCFIDSATRHLLKYLRGDKDEPHDKAFLWNMMCCIWTQENKPELIDL